MFYEMITNRSAFDEKSPARLMAAILSKEPPPIDAASGMPAEFQWIVQNCLAKDPDDRWQSMGDVAKVLKGIAQHAAMASAVSGPRAATRLDWLPRCYRGGMWRLACCVRPSALLSRTRTPGPVRSQCCPRRAAHSGSRTRRSRARSSPSRRMPDRSSSSPRPGESARCGCRSSAGPEPRLLPGTAGRRIRSGHPIVSSSAFSRTAT